MPPRQSVDPLESIAARVARLEAQLQLVLASTGGVANAPRAPTRSRDLRKTSPSSAHAEASRATLEVDGALVGKRTTVWLNGAQAPLQDSVFILLLRCVVANSQERGSWSTREALCIAKTPWMPSRLCRACTSFLPAGIRLIEADRREHFRLNPRVVVERVDAAALTRHPDAIVRALAAQLKA